MSFRAYTKILVTHEFTDLLEMHMFTTIVAANTTFNEINVIAQSVGACWQGILKTSPGTWHLACAQNIISSYLNRICRNCVIISRYSTNLPN